MKTKEWLPILTFLNLVLLAFSVVHQIHPVIAQSASSSVVRGRALELVDDTGRVRAEIKVFSADPRVRMPDGARGYPETVLLRLINSKGAPTVKIAATEDGSAVSLGGASDPTDIQILARGKNTSLKLTNKDGKQQLIKP
jgi:hypothetical protein